MARIRTIKPEFPHSESIGNVSRDARLAFILMWTIADDSGRLRGNSRMLASLLFPYDDDAPKKIDGWIDELQTQGCVVRYKAETSEYIQIENWLKHQRIDKPTPSKIPEFQEDSKIIREDSKNTPVRKGREGKGEEGIIGDEQECDFDVFWKAYPHKVGKGDAIKSFKAAIKKTTIDEIIKAIHRYVQTKPPDRPYCNPSTWLNQERWNDEPAKPTTTWQAKPTEQRTGAITL